MSVLLLLQPLKLLQISKATIYTLREVTLMTRKVTVRCLVSVVSVTEIVRRVNYVHCVFMGIRMLEIYHIHGQLKQE